MRYTTDLINNLNSNFIHKNRENVFKSIRLDTLSHFRGIPRYIIKKFLLNVFCNVCNREIIGSAPP